MFCLMNGNFSGDLIIMGGATCCARAMVNYIGWVKYLSALTLNLSVPVAPLSYRASTSFLHSLRSCAARLALFQVMLLLLSSCSHELNKISSWSPALSFSPHGGFKQCLPGCAELQFYQHVLCTTKM